MLVAALTSRFHVIEHAGLVQCSRPNIFLPLGRLPGSRLREWQMQQMMDVRNSSTKTTRPRAARWYQTDLVGTGGYCDAAACPPVRLSACPLRCRN